MKFINLTPHDIVVIRPDGEKIIFPKSGQVARVTTIAEVIGNIDGIDVVKTKYGAIEGLPDPEPDTVYIVSLLVMQALQASEVYRSDVIGPDTGPQSVVRNEDGQIVGVRRFQQI